MHAFFFLPGPPNLVMSWQLEQTPQSFLRHPSHELQCLCCFEPIEGHCDISYIRYDSIPLFLIVDFSSLHLDVSLSSL